LYLTPPPEDKTGCLLAARLAPSQEGNFGAREEWIVGSGQGTEKEKRESSKKDERPV